MNAIQDQGQPTPNYRKWVLFCGLAIWLLMVGITFLGSQFEYEIPNRERPIRIVTTLFILSTVISLLAVWLALKITQPGRDFLVFVFLFAISFRLIQLFCIPFQEIDHYRYIWDGIVVANGKSPYRFSPYQVLHGQQKDPELKALNQLAFGSPETATIVSRIHYSHVRTVYPPVSQAVFGMTMALVPRTASITTHVITMKAAVTFFDLATLFLLAYLLSLLKMNPLWSMVYAWNPLIIKEFSNSGHLDSIAVFFVLAALVCVIRLMHFVESRSDSESANRRWVSWAWMFSGAILLAAGTAAKIYPLIFAPLFAWAIWRAVDWKKGIVFGLLFLAGSAAFLYPMSRSMVRNPLAAEEADRNKEGLTTFLRHWQMNEWAYMLVYQNLREVDPRAELNQPWFRVLNEATRKKLLKSVGSFSDPEDAPYLLSRMITLGLFSFFYLLLLAKVWRSRKNIASEFLTCCFWLVAIFFCLQPTQNPWYWTWAVPLLPFARNLGWLLYSPMLLTYYYRFWFSQHDGPYDFLGQSYTGAGLFDYVLVWLEHLPVFFSVAIFPFLIKRRANQEQSAEVSNG